MKTVGKSLYADGYKLTVGLLVSGKPDFRVVKIMPTVNMITVGINKFQNIC